jgi:hypothetical protein
VNAVCLLEAYGLVPCKEKDKTAVLTRVPSNEMEKLFLAENLLKRIVRLVLDYPGLKGQFSAFGVPEFII